MVILVGVGEWGQMLLAEGIAFFPAKCSVFVQRKLLGNFSCLLKREKSQLLGFLVDLLGIWHGTEAQHPVANSFSQSLACFCLLSL